MSTESKRQIELDRLFPLASDEETRIAPLSEATKQSLRLLFFIERACRERVLRHVVAWLRAGTPRVEMEIAAGNLEEFLEEEVGT